jgi:hypothetical protein
VHRRWIQRTRKDGSSYLEEVPVNFKTRSRNCSDNDALISERHYDGMRATDGTDISTRAKHREYMRRNNLTTIDDFKQEWADAPRKRELEARKGTREAIERAIHHLEGPP